MKGLMISSWGSGTGKTLLTLGLLRSFVRKGYRVQSAKVGPDYLDPSFHRCASGGSCLNLDLWSMSAQGLTSLVASCAQDHDFVLCEGVMGAFDGPVLGQGSTADVARLFNWPLIFVLPVSGFSATLGSLIYGLVRQAQDQGCHVAGVILNGVKSPRHFQLLTSDIHQDIPVLGKVPWQNQWLLSSRHLGLVSAKEYDNVDSFIDQIADQMSDHMDISVLASYRGGIQDMDDEKISVGFRPLAQKIAIARDEAFGFLYDHVMDHWYAQGAELSFFSPLKNQGPDPQAQAVYLPGGYPELYLAQLAQNTKFKDGMIGVAKNDKPILGECGGYMVLGQSFQDEKGVTYPMLGLLPINGQFSSKSKMTMGYRRAELLTPFSCWEKGQVFYGHEFHYGTVKGETGGLSLYDSENRCLGNFGSHCNQVFGSFFHFIDEK